MPTLHTTATLIIFTLCALIIAGLIAQPWWVSRRRARLRANNFPQAWRRILRRRVPFVQRLPADLQLRLKQDIMVFLAEKPIIGCGGLTVTDDMRVTIAAQACIPLLGARRGYYPKLSQILLYPAAFVVDRVQPAPGIAGVEIDQRRVLAGESWVQGQVILSWQDVLAGAQDPSDGRNVVIHEFAHQLDQHKGHANGAPLLPTKQAYQAWSGVMQHEFNQLRSHLDAGEPTLIDPYAATDPAEFFAVTSEIFFEQPNTLAEHHPALYEQLTAYYKVNPTSWS